jgi:hypothetical protein
MDCDLIVNYYHGNHNFTLEDSNRILQLFMQYANKCAVADVSEYLNLNNGTKKRSAFQCRSIYIHQKNKAFEFAVCLN